MTLVGVESFIGEPVAIVLSITDSGIIETEDGSTLVQIPMKHYGTLIDVDLTHGFLILSPPALINIDHVVSLKISKEIDEEAPNVFN